MRAILRAIWRKAGPLRLDSLWMAVLFCLGLPSYLRSLLRRQSDRTREVWSGANDLDVARDIAVFVHFDPEGEVAGWLETYLQQLFAAGFAVLFVSNAPRLTAATIDRIRPYCSLILRRDNVGHDFGGYRDGLRRIPDLGGVRRLILANDSVYGPFRPAAQFIADMPPDRAAVWGVTDSREGHYHLQSYFLLFHVQALQSAAFARFWRGARFVQSRYWNILMRELRMTRIMAGSGLACRALCATDEAWSILAGRDAVSPLPVSRLPLNPTHDLWRVLVAEMGCPFIKRDLLRGDAADDRTLGEWRDVVASVGDYDTSMIERQPAERDA